MSDQPESTAHEAFTGIGALAAGACAVIGVWLAPWPAYAALLATAAVIVAVVAVLRRFT